MEKKTIEETIEETFTYDVAIPVSRRLQHRVEEGYDEGDTKWYVIEKGIKKFEEEIYLHYFSASRIRTALFDIREHIRKTSIKNLSLEDMGPSKVYIKSERTQWFHSVQVRGVIYTLLQLSDEQKRKGVITISRGYFACILCALGKYFEIPVTVVMPSSTAHAVVDTCHTKLSATVIARGNNMVDVHEIALRNARRNGLLYLDGNDHPNMIIGQATLGIEIFEQTNDFDVLILSTMIDGCGLTAGIALAVKEYIPNKKIIEVQIDLQDSSIDDVRKKTNDPNELDIPSRRSEAYVNFQTIQKGLFDLTIFVSTTEVQKEINLLRLKNIHDYYGAMAVAAIRSGRLDDLIKGKRVLIPLFGRTELSDLLVSFLSSSNEPSLEPRAGPSTSSS